MTFWALRLISVVLSQTSLVIQSIRIHKALRVQRWTFQHRKQIKMILP